MKAESKNYPPLIKSILSTDDFLTGDILTTRGRIYTFLNPVSYLTARKHEAMLAGFDGVMVDGSVLAAAVRLLYGRSVKRRSFDMVSVASLLFRHIVSEGKTVYLTGARQEQLENAMGTLSSEYPGMRVAGYRNGYFSSKEEIEEECKRIIRLDPDYVIAGMGMPLQERFLLQLKASGYRGVGFTCGNFIAQLSMRGIDYYPSWADRYNLRFLYRFYKEKHTRERYLRAAVLFPFYFIRDRLKSRQF